MEIERCLAQGDRWKIIVRYEGQPVRVSIANENVADLITGENPSEVHVLDALRDHKARFEEAVRSAVVDNDFRPAEFSSLQVERE